MRYFFDIFDGEDWACDDHGINCDGEMGARRQEFLSLLKWLTITFPLMAPAWT